MAETPSFEDIEKTILEVCEEGFPSVSLKERQKQLEEQIKMVEESERKFSTPTWEHMQRRFTI